MGRILEWALRLWAGCLVLFAVLWVLGPFGLGLIVGEDIGRPLTQYSLQTTPLGGLLSGPAFEVDLSEALYADYRPPSDTATLRTGDGGSYGDLVLDLDAAFTSLTGAQSVAFTALQVVPLLVTAALWWSLAGMVARSRGESAFTAGNARRLRTAGVVLGVGAPLLTLLTWLLHRWVLSTSQYADQASVPWPSLDAWPWAAIALGFALVVLGGVWARGVALERDVAGLV